MSGWAVTCDMDIPAPAFLHSVELLYAVRYPVEFKSLCRRLAARNVVSRARGTFITDMETFHRVNVRLGEEKWGGDQRSALGQQRPDDPLAIRGELVPFYVEGRDIFGFASDVPESDAVHVWSVHALVHTYSSLPDFTKNHLHDTIDSDPPAR